MILFAALSRVCPIAAIASWGVGFGPPETAGAVRTEEAFHRAKAVLDPKAAFGDQLVAPLLGGAERAVACGLAQDPVAMLAAQPLAIGLAGIGFVGQHPPGAGPFDHTPELRARGAARLAGVARILSMKPSSSARAKAS